MDSETSNGEWTEILPNKWRYTDPWNTNIVVRRPTSRERYRWSIGDQDYWTGKIVLFDTNAPPDWVIVYPDDIWWVRGSLDHAKEEALLFYFYNGAS